MEQTFAWDGESCQFLGIFVQLHLPESRSEVQCQENGGIGLSNVADAFRDLLHGVLVDVGVLVQFPEVLYDPESLALFPWNAEHG